MGCGGLAAATIADSSHASNNTIKTVIFAATAAPPATPMFAPNDSARLPQLVYWVVESACNLELVERPHLAIESIGWGGCLHGGSLH